MRQSLGMVICLLCMMLIPVSLCFGHGEEIHDEGGDPQPELEISVGVDERLGETLDLGGRWWNEMGERVNPQEVLELPTLLIPGYYHCPKSCNLLLAAMATAVRDLDLFPDRDYRVVAVSISDDEGAAHAATAQAQYFKILGGGYPKEAWPFLVGDKESVARLCDSMGYRFTKRGPHSYIHPNVAVVVAPGGTIIRYLYGPKFLTADLKKGMEEAAIGVASVSIHRVVSFCFDYDPKNRAYVLNIYRTMGSLTLTLVGLLFIYLVVTPTAHKSRGMKKG